MSTDGNQKTNNNNADMSNNGPVTGVPNKTKVVTIKGNQIPQNQPINSETGGRVPNPNTVQNKGGQGVQQAPKQSGGGPEGAAVQNNQALGQAVQPGTQGQAGQQQDPDDIDIGKFISESTAEIKTGEEKETERHKKTKFLTKALESLQKYERIIFSNSETGKFVGTKMQYVKDDEGKSVYDYMNDEAVTEHIEFIVPEGDPQDGSPVNQQVTFYWKKPTF